MTKSSGAVSSIAVKIELPTEVHDKLARISAITRCDLASLAAEAVSDYVEQHLPIIEKIQEGLDDIRAGRVFSHEEVMSGLQEIIDRAGAERAGKG